MESNTLTSSFSKYATAGPYHWKAIDSSWPNRLQDYSLTLMARYRIILNHIQGNEQRILEIGCGDGALCHLLALEGHFVTGFDLEADGIQLAQEKTAGHHYRHTPRFECADAGRYASEKSFDYVIMADVIEHLDDPDAAIKTAAKLLRPGGKLLLTTPYRKPEGKWDTYHVKEYVESDLRGLLQRYSSDVSVRPFHAYWLHRVYANRLARRVLNVVTVFTNPFLWPLMGRRPAMLFSSATLNKA